MFKCTLTVVTLAGLIGSSAQAHNYEIDNAIAKVENKKQAEKLYSTLLNLRCTHD